MVFVKGSELVTSFFMQSYPKDSERIPKATVGFKCKIICKGV